MQGAKANQSHPASKVVLHMLQPKAPAAKDFAPIPKFKPSDVDQNGPVGKPSINQQITKATAKEAKQKPVLSGVLHTVEHTVSQAYKGAMKNQRDLSNPDSP